MQREPLELAQLEPTEYKQVILFLVIQIAKICKLSVTVHPDVNQSWYETCYPQSMQSSFQSMGHLGNVGWGMTFT